MNGTYWHDIDLLGKITRTKQKTPKTLLTASKKAGLEENSENSKYMVKSLEEK